MEKFSQEIRERASKAGEAERKQILDDLRDLAYSIETPEDTASRIMFYNLQLAGVRIGIDLKIFNLLSESEGPLTLDQLVEKTKADTLLLARILRYLASTGTIKEVSKNTFAATNVTKTLAIPGWQGGIYHYFDSVGPQYQALPDYLAENGYKHSMDPNKTAFHKGMKTDIPPFAWFQQNPKAFGNFLQYMGVQRQGMPTWLSVYPITEEAKGLTAEQTLLVDIGGGFGQQCALLKGVHPDLPGRVVNQDLPHAIGMAIPTPGVENNAHDFFTPQPEKEAKYYYMRNILHDWPDEKCVLILENIKPALGKDSVILIDEVVLPESNVHWQTTQLDLTMMCAFNSIERTKEQWEALFDKAGFQIKQVYTYTDSLSDSIIVVVPK